MTYSILARDEETGELGSAFQSHFFAVGSVVPFAIPGVGQIASQAFAERAFGPLGLDLMLGGLSPERTLAALTGSDPQNVLRQVAIMDAEGVIAQFTGSRCVPYAGHAVAPGVAAQGNMLARDGLWDVMIDAFLSSRGALADRLLMALNAAERSGGDSRGTQSACLLVVPAEGPRWETTVNLRVDDHPSPLDELGRLIKLQHAYRTVVEVRHSFLANEQVTPLSPLDCDAAVRALDQAQFVTGENAEPSTWKVVVLARANRLDDALSLAARLTARHPPLGEFFANLASVGILPDDSRWQMHRAASTRSTT